MSSNDPRFQVGAPVHAKAMHVTALIECHRRYGSNAKTKLVNGTVSEIKTVPSSTQKRAVTLITAIYTLGGQCVKVATLNSRSVKAGHVAAIPDERNEPVTGLGTDVSIPINIANEAPGVNLPDHVMPMDVNNAATINNIETIVPGASSNAANAAAAGLHHSPEDVSETLLLHGDTTNASSPPVIATVNGVEWVRASINDPPLNGNVPFRMWNIRNMVGEVLIPGHNTTVTQDMLPLDFFLLMFPPKQLLDMVHWTNCELGKLELKQTSSSELLKLFGIIILTTKFEFTSRTSLWQTTAWTKYQPAPQFGLTGMSKHRFEDLFRTIRWSYQPDVPDVGTSSEQHRWRLVDDFVKNFNDYRANYFNPSDLICVDESMSRWYGKGGHWINHGLPQYIAIDRKPENGCKIQNAACGRSGVMIRLKLVKGADLMGADDDDEVAGNESSLLHGTNVLKQVVSPWFGSNRIVCADSYFASVGAAEELFRNGLRFIGVVKTATRGFPKTFLSSVELESRGDFLALKRLASDNKPSLGAFVWMDRERRYFISTAGTLEAGTPYVRLRWRQLDQAPNAAPEQVTFSIQQPKIAEIYYSTCAAIDKHNRLRQDDLRIEKKIETKDWSMRVNLSIFSMIVVDTWLVYSTFKSTPAGVGYNQKEFYAALAEELIDNSYGNRGRADRPRSSPTGSSFQDACIRALESAGPRAGVLTHLTPVKRLKNSKGEKTTFRYQGRCKECQKKSTWQCSDCDDDGKTVYLCATKNGQRCFLNHLSRNHAQLNE
ncbi:Transposase IS4 [Fragilaria crotonensis]|nr:Transposase IS4 [Fragilaria crotonensis]